MASQVMVLVGVESCLVFGALERTCVAAAGDVCRADLTTVRQLFSISEKNNELLARIHRYH